MAVPVRSVEVLLYAVVSVSLFDKRDTVMNDAVLQDHRPGQRAVALPFLPFLQLFLYLITTSIFLPLML